LGSSPLPVLGQLDVSFNVLFFVALFFEVLLIVLLVALVFKLLRTFIHHLPVL